MNPMQFYVDLYYVYIFLGRGFERTWSYHQTPWRLRTPGKKPPTGKLAFAAKWSSGGGGCVKSEMHLMMHEKQHKSMNQGKLWQLSLTQGLQSWTELALFWQMVHWRRCVISFSFGLKVTLKVYFEIVFVLLVFLLPWHRAAAPEAATLPSAFTVHSTSLILTELYRMQQWWPLISETLLT